MIKTMRHQKLPAAGPAREALREKGQFWTPDWVADAMTQYVLDGGSQTVFDPAVGAGAFFRAAKRVAAELDRKVLLCGTELDPRTLEQAIESGLSRSDLRRVQNRDFVLDPPRGPIESVVANPPYIRHHRLPSETKQRLRALGAELTGRPLDGRAGIHVYFLLRALQLLSPDGRLAFIMPADTCEGVFARQLWSWITRCFSLDAVVTFVHEASPFPGVDTNAVIFMIRKGPIRPKIAWARCLRADSSSLKKWVASSFRRRGGDLLTADRTLEEALQTGLSRAPQAKAIKGPRLLEFATVVRGVATGANDFFFLTQRQASDAGIPRELLRRAVGRTRDIPTEEVDSTDLESLDRSGRATYLFSPDGRAKELFPPAVRRYLEKGEALDLPTRSLIASRRPWYKMEVRRVPAFLFAYLGRRNARFIKNSADVIPLTGFLCIYPRSEEPSFVSKLWQVLRHPDTVKNLALVGKSYGSGAIKVEPRALEQLTLPLDVVESVGLQVPAGIKPRQLPLVSFTQKHT